MTVRRALPTLLLGGLLGILAVLGAQHLLTGTPRQVTATPQHPLPNPSIPPTGKAAASAPGHADAAQPMAAPLAMPDWNNTTPTAEQVMYAQPALMRQALARLQPQRPGKVDLYLISFAGDGGEDVFRNEAEYAARLFARRFDARGHTVVLENNPATVGRAPLATWSNLEIALAGVHKIMDPAQDILMVYLTSHGSDDHGLLVDLASLPLDPIYSDDLASILDEYRFAWKVVVVNACYSGGFVAPLQGPGTLILTAASSDRSSFGCGSESRITYFGDAWLARALNHDANLIDAFKDARTVIAQWEKRGKLTPSMPQISIGAGIADRLKSWQAGFTPGPVVPFKPARTGGRQKR